MCPIWSICSSADDDHRQYRGNDGGNSRQLKDGSETFFAIWTEMDVAFLGNVGVVDVAKKQVEDVAR